MRSLQLLLVFFFLSLSAPAQKYSIKLEQAGTLFSEGYYRDAAELYDQWLPLAKKARGMSETAFHEYTLSAGRCYCYDGQFEKALLLYHSLQEYYAGQSIPDLPRRAQNLDDMGYCYHRMGNYKLALPLYKEAIEMKEEVLGIHHPEYARSLDHLASLLTDMGNYQEAFPMFEEAEAILSETVGHKHPLYGRLLEDMGCYYFATSDFAAAKTFIQKALDTRSENPGKKHPDYANSLNSMAAIMFFTGNYTDAATLYEESLSIVRQALGNKHMDFARSMNNLAVLYKRMGKYEDALTLMQEASAIYRENLGPRHPYYATSLFNVAGLYSALGNYASALPLLLEVKTIRAELLGREHVDYARCLNDLANLYCNLNLRDEALPLYLEAIPVLLKQLGSHNLDYGNGLHNLAMLYVRMGKYEPALLLFEEAKMIIRELFGTNHTDYSILLNNQSLLFSEMGDYQKAIGLLEESVRIDREAFGSRHLNLAIELMNLANYYAASGSNKPAFVLLEEVLSIFRELGLTHHPDYAFALNNMAMLNLRLEKPNDALEQLNEAGNIYLETVGSRHANYAMTISNKAHVLMHTGDLSQALILLEEAVSIFRAIKETSHPDFLQCIKDLVQVYDAMGKLEAAVPYLDEAFSQTNKNIRQNFSFLTESEKRNYMDKIGDLYDIYLSLLYHNTSTNPALACQAYDNELLIKGLVLSATSTMQRVILESGDTGITSRFEQLRSLRRQINFWQQKPASERKIDLNQLEQQVTDLERDITRRSRTYVGMISSLNTTWEDISKKLSHDQAAIEFVRFPYTSLTGITDSILYCALLLRSNQAPVLVKLCTEILLRNAILFPGSSSKEINKSYFKGDLYSLIWAPLDSLLNDVKTIYFAPSGLLNNIAMGAITCSQDQVMLEKYKLIQLSSTRILTTPFENETFMTAVVYGGIQYDSDSTARVNQSLEYQEHFKQDKPLNTEPVTEVGRSGFKYLPGTLKEAEMIAAKLRKSGIQTSTFTGVNALEESFVNLSGEHAPAIIHLATHGFYYPSTTDSTIGQAMTPGSAEKFIRFSENPLFRSGLLLAGANYSWKGNKLPATIEDGILTAKEVSILNLMNTKLVVLSACQTGQGDIIGSEGVEGLQRGFKMAGVRYLVMSLWQVPDKETSQFMDLFYTRWLEGSSIRDAFQIAQLEMKAKFPGEPFKWAGFILVE